MAAVSLMNGQRQGWGDIRMVAYGRYFSGITEIDLKVSQEKSNEYGAGREAVHMGEGNKKYEGHSITLNHYEVFALVQAIKDAGGDDLTDAAPSTVSFILTPHGNDVPTRIDVPNWRWTDSGLGLSSKQGDKSIPMKLGAISGKPKFSTF